MKSSLASILETHVDTTAAERQLLTEHHIKITLSAKSEFLNPEVFQYPALFSLAFGLQTALFGSYLHWRWPGLTQGVCYALIAGFVLLSLAALVQAARIQMNRNLRVYFATMMLASCGLGYLYGNWIYSEYMGPYYTYDDLKIYHNVDPRKDRGSRYPDAGIAYFTPGSQLMRSNNACLKTDNLYCVVPIVNCAPYGNCTLDTDSGSIDFWAVGKDCCDCPNGEFRCGAWNNAVAHGGLRQIDDHDLAYYKLAVKEWEAAYGRKARTPVFFYWELRPRTRSDAMWGGGMSAACLGIAGFSSFQIIASAVNDLLGII